MTSKPRVLRLPPLHGGYKPRPTSDARVARGEKPKPPPGRGGGSPKVT